MNFDDCAEAIESAAHALADQHAMIDQAWFLRGVSDAMLGRYDESAYVDCRYYRLGFVSMEDAF